MRRGRIAGQLRAGSSEPEIMFLATGERDIAEPASAKEPVGEESS
jgi:hypothetical protein